MFYLAVHHRATTRSCSYTWKSLKDYLERYEIEYAVNSYGYVKFTVRDLRERRRIEELLKRFDRNIYIITKQSLFGTGVLKF